MDILAFANLTNSTDAAPNVGSLASKEARRVRREDVRSQTEKIRLALHNREINLSKLDGAEALYFMRDVSNRVAFYATPGCGPGAPPLLPVEVGSLLGSLWDRRPNAIIIDRSQVHAVAEGTAALHHFIAEIAKILRANGSLEPQVSGWVTLANGSSEWGQPTQDARARPMLCTGAFLQALRLGGLAAVREGSDLMVSEGVGSKVAPIDWRSIREAARSGNWKFFEERIHDYADWRERLVRERLAKELARLPKADLILRATPGARKVVLDEDDEVLGHYLAAEAALDLPSKRKLGEAFEFQLSSTQLQRFSRALAELLRGRLDSSLVSELAEEFGLGDEVVRATLKWYAGRLPNSHTRVRLKIEKLVIEASKGRGRLLFIHREE